MRSSAAVWMSCLLVLGCGSAPKPVPTGADLKISNVLVLPLPSGSLLPSEEEQVLVYLGRQLHQVHKLNVYCGRAVGRSVWGPLDKIPGQAVKGFNRHLAEGRKSFGQLRIRLEGILLDLLDQPPHQGVTHV